MPVELSTTGTLPASSLLAEGASAVPAAEKGPENAFAAVFADAVRQVENYRAGAEDSVKRFLSGETEELHKVAIGAQQAELSFDLFLQVKNRVVQAYQEVMRMQL